MIHGRRTSHKQKSIPFLYFTRVLYSPNSCCVSKLISEQHINNKITDTKAKTKSQKPCTESCKHTNTKNKENPLETPYICLLLTFDLLEQHMDTVARIQT